MRDDVAATVDDENAIFSNKVEDNVKNLEAFVAGFTVERPTAVALEDIDVVTLPGPAKDNPMAENRPRRSGSASRRFSISRKLASV